MDKRLYDELNESAIRDARKRSVKRYLIDNWIAILALMVAIIALFR